jgi:hypothetical protein
VATTAKGYDCGSGPTESCCGTLTRRLGVDSLVDGQFVRRCVKALTIELKTLAKRSVVADFDGGTITCDAGAVLLDKTILPFTLRMLTCESLARSVASCH